ncbi:hypothetical protein [Mycoplasmopsis caviae]|uniref:hypothetical protein n=1 Tax=Mycoplasmopsis caviae TaxID=55603 RepID=UPI0038CD3AF7
MGKKLRKNVKVKRRYYGGCENVDVVEKLAIERAKELFNVRYVNVQPYSGSVANALHLHH